jgi:hypothetical protein
MFTNSVISGYSDIRQSSGENPDIQITATGPYGQTITKTGEGGKFLFTGLGDGTYSLNFSKEGYGSVKMYNIQLFGNDTAYVRQVSLFKKYDNFQMPEFTKISVVSDPRYGQNPVIVIETTWSSNSQMPVPFPVVLFVDSLKSVSYKNFAQVVSNVNPAYTQSASGRIDFFFYPFGLPFRKGSLVYFQAYVANPYELYSGYFDNYLGINQYSTLIPEKHSPVMSFIMP